MVFWELDYNALSRRCKTGNNRSVFYRAKPHPEDKELEAEVYLIWNGKRWYAIVDGKYKENGSYYNYFSKGPFNLNNSAFKMLCRGFNIPFAYMKDRKFLERTNPSDLEKIAEYTKINNPATLPAF